jgi:hypothetical protein
MTAQEAVASAEAKTESVTVSAGASPAADTQNLKPEKDDPMNNPLGQDELKRDKDDPMNNPLGQDEFTWLEEIHGEKALDWVQGHNNRVLGMMEKRTGSDVEGSELYGKILKVLDSHDKIPHCQNVGHPRDDTYFNFWQDDKHVRGIWRKTSYAEYKKDGRKLGVDDGTNDEETKWELLLDVDELCKTESESWVWGYEGASVYHDHNEDCFPTRALIHLSRGGSDATVIREFDIQKKEFVKPEDGGFFVPEAKSEVRWKDKDTLFIGTKFTDAAKEGLTDSGYPRIIREWKRGTDLQKDSVTIYEGAQEVMEVRGYRDSWPYFGAENSENIENSQKKDNKVTNHSELVKPQKTKCYDWLCNRLTFYTSEHRVKVSVEGDNLSAEDLAEATTDYEKILLPEDFDVSSYYDYIIAKPRKKWGAFEAGSLLVANFQELLRKQREIGKDGEDSIRY